MSHVTLKTSQKGKLSEVTIGNLTVWFSYETPIAYQSMHDPLRVCENVWSAATGKHLNAIDGGDKASRLPREQFLTMLTVMGDAF